MSEVKLLKKVTDIVENVFDFLLFMLFVGLFSTVILQIVARFIPELIVIWTEELTMLFYFYIIALGAPMAVKYGMYARVDIIFMLVPLKVRLFLEVLAGLLIVVFFVGLIFASWPLIALGGRRLTFAMQLPMIIFLITMPLMAVTSALAAVGRTVFLFQDLLKPERVLQREEEAAEKQALENEAIAEQLRQEELAALERAKGAKKV